MSYLFKGRLTFVPDILDKDLEFQDKSMVHELLNFHYPNHGRKFKRILEMYCEEGLE